MEDYISISTLNDFIFCPYSIYLHNVYMETDEWENIKLNISERFTKLFTGADSVLIFDAPNAKVEKFGNAIHRDRDVVYL